MLAYTHIGIIREGKQPPDKRVPFSPEQCLKLMKIYPGLQITIQPSAHRCIADEAYTAAGLPVAEDLSHCDVLMGIKEVPVADLLPGKTYLFFSHTIKKQPHNRPLLREVLSRNITLVDYETLTWANGSRLLGFGRWAGIVGLHNGLLAYGNKTGLFQLKAAHACADYGELLAQYKAITLPPLRMCITGDGRVAHGVLELMEKLNIREVTPRAYRDDTFSEPVFVHLRSEHYYEHHDSRPWDKSDFYHNPEDYFSTFRPYTRVTDLLVNGIFWQPGVPLFFTREEMKAEDFSIQVIADISCDIPGSLPSTLRSTSIENPVYGYHPFTQQATEPGLQNTVDVMAVGNLPCELPLDASLGFGDDLIRSVMPHLLQGSDDDIIHRATIAAGGKLTSRFQYLADYVA